MALGLAGGSQQRAQLALVVVDDPPATPASGGGSGSSGGDDGFVDCWRGAIAKKMTREEKLRIAKQLEFAVEPGDVLVFAWGERETPLHTLGQARKVTVVVVVM